MSTMLSCMPMQMIYIYADDVVMFIRPTASDLRFVREALHIFGNASGLCINYEKLVAILIREEDGDKDLFQGAMPWRLENFPCKYLGLQLSIWQLTRSKW